MCGSGGAGINTKAGEERLKLCWDQVWTRSTDAELKEGETRRGDAAVPEDWQRRSHAVVPGPDLCPLHGRTRHTRTERWDTLVCFTFLIVIIFSKVLRARTSILLISSHGVNKHMKRGMTLEDFFEFLLPLCYQVSPIEITHALLFRGSPVFKEDS